jgi:hypothetical protein
MAPPGTRSQSADVPIDRPGPLGWLVISGDHRATTQKATPRRVW